VNGDGDGDGDGVNIGRKRASERSRVDGNEP